MKTLVWITNTMRTDSRLFNQLEGMCTFVYYSPYYFADKREKAILKQTSQKNLELFYGSINHLDNQLREYGSELNIFKDSDPVSHINDLIQRFSFDTLIIDQPQFAMWHTIDLDKLSIKPQIIDSCLIQTDCRYKTAKHRWMDHVKRIPSKFFTPYNLKFFGFSLPSIGQSKYPKGYLPNIQQVLNRAYEISNNYKYTRDNHDGQMELSTLFQNGVIDPHNIFYTIAKQFQDQGSDLSINDGNHAATLRQFAFRELNIINARNLGLTMEDHSLRWAEKIITNKSFENLINHKNPDSNLLWDHIINANTPDPEINQILRESFKKGVMPNRARMYYAGWLFYNSKNGIEALSYLINTFDLLLTDGQCPNNYMQCCSCMNLQYGKVMLLNKNRVMDLLNY